MKKLLISLGTIGLVVSPALVVVSCSESNTLESPTSSTGTESSKNSTMNNKKDILSKMILPTKILISTGAMIASDIAILYDEAINELEEAKSQGSSTNNSNVVDLAIQKANQAIQKATKYNTEVTSANTQLINDRKNTLSSIALPTKVELITGATLPSNIVTYDTAQSNLRDAQAASTSDSMSVINAAITKAAQAKTDATTYNAKALEANNNLIATKKQQLAAITLPAKVELTTSATLPSNIVTYDTAQSNLRDAQASSTSDSIDALNAAITKAEQAKTDATTYNAKVLEINNNLIATKKQQLAAITLPAKVELITGATLPSNIVTYDTAQSNLRDAQASSTSDSIDALNAAITKAEQAKTDATTYNTEVTKINSFTQSINSKRAELIGLSLPAKENLLVIDSTSALSGIVSYEQVITHLATAKAKAKSNDIHEVEAGILAAKEAIKEAQAYNIKVIEENTKLLVSKKTELRAITLDPKVALKAGISLPADSNIVTYELAAQALADAKAIANSPSVTLEQLNNAINAAKQAKTNAVNYNAKINELNGNQAAALESKKHQLASIELPAKVILFPSLTLSITESYDHAQTVLTTAKATTGDLTAINNAITQANNAITEANTYNAAVSKKNSDYLATKKQELNAKTLPTEVPLLDGAIAPIGITTYTNAKTALTSAKSKSNAHLLNDITDAITIANKAIQDATTYNTKVTEANNKLINDKKAELASIVLPEKISLLSGATLEEGIVLYTVAQTHLSEAQHTRSNDIKILNAAITKAKQAKIDATTYNTKVTEANNKIINAKKSELTKITLPVKATLLDGVTLPDGVTSYETAQTLFSTAKAKLLLPSLSFEVLTQAITNAKTAKTKADAYNTAVNTANLTFKKQSLTSLRIPEKLTASPGVTPPTDTYTQAKVDFDEALTHTNSNNLDEINSAIEKANNAISIANAYNSVVTQLNAIADFSISKSFANFNDELTRVFDKNVTHSIIAIQKANHIVDEFQLAYDVKFDNLVIRSATENSVIFEIKFLSSGNADNDNVNLGGSPNIVLHKNDKLKFEVSNIHSTVDHLDVLKTKIYVNDKLITDSGQIPFKFRDYGASDLTYIGSIFELMLNLRMRTKYASILVNAGWNINNSWSFARSFLPGKINAFGKSAYNAANKLTDSEVIELLKEIGSHLHVIEKKLIKYDPSDKWIAAHQSTYYQVDRTKGRILWLFSGSVDGTKYLNANGPEQDYSFLEKESIKSDFSLTDEQVNSVTYAIVSASSDWFSFGAKINPATNLSTLNLILNNVNNGGMVNANIDNPEDKHLGRPVDLTVKLNELNDIRYPLKEAIFSIQYISATVGYIFVGANGTLGYIAPDNSITFKKLEVFKRTDNKFYNKDKSYYDINHIIPDGNGGFFVLGANNLLVNINADGTTKPTWKNCQFPYHDDNYMIITSIAFDPVNKRVYVGNRAGMLFFADGKTTVPKTFVFWTYLERNSIDYIVPNSDGTLYISNSFNHMIDKITAEGYPVDGWYSHAMSTLSKNLSDQVNAIFFIEPSGHDGLFVTGLSGSKVFMKHISSNGDLIPIDGNAQESIDFIISYRNISWIIDKNKDKLFTSSLIELVDGTINSPILAIATNKNGDYIYSTIDGRLHHATIVREL